MKHSLIVLSGGQDSMTCLGLALHNKDKVSAISFDYNQRHAVELQAAKDVCSLYGVPHKMVNMGGMLTDLVTSALTGVGDVGLPHAYKPGLPSSFVPGRNALFLTLAHAYAQEIRADTVMTGVCETDYSGYPDCRSGFILSMEAALNLGYQTNIRVKAPLMERTKAETFALAALANFLPIVINESHTCYRGDHTTAHEWGYGCGNCPACELRAKGFAEYVANITDQPNFYHYLNANV